MNKKLTGLMFVVVIAGCHSPSEGAICPAPEEAVAEPEPTPFEHTPEIDAEIEKAKRRIRETRQRWTE